MRKKTLNIYRQWSFARYAFNTAIESLKEGDVASPRDLIIKNESNITVYGCYTNENDFYQKYLLGWIWNEINDYANLPYNVWKISQSRLIQTRTNENPII